MNITSEQFKVGDKFLCVVPADKLQSDTGLWELTGWRGCRPQLLSPTKYSLDGDEEQPYLIPIPKGATEDQVKALLNIVLDK